jgi:hypothetical protein
MSLERTEGEEKMKMNEDWNEKDYKREKRRLDQMKEKKKRRWQDEEKRQRRFEYLEGDEEFDWDENR